MAGHNKWSKIKHKKGANDAKRGKLLTKHSKIITVLGQNDPNPETNSSLRAAIANAKSDGVPKDNIERVLKKIAGGTSGENYSQQVYEGYGPSSIPFVVTALTDNVKRTFPEIRTVFEKAGGNLGTPGSVMFMFDHIGLIKVKTSDKSEDELFEMAINAGGDDFEYDTEESTIYTSFENLGKARDALEKEGLEVLKAEAEYQSKDPQILDSSEKLEKIESFIETLEDLDDVDEVFGGFDVDQSLIS